MTAFVAWTATVPPILFAIGAGGAVLAVCVLVWWALKPTLYCEEV
jgi:hypothetical protein